MTVLAAGLASLLPEARAPADEARVDLRLDRLGTEDGLSHGAVPALAQDRAGFIWIGTPAGVDRWDGYTARHYEPESSVTALLVDRDDRLWVGTTTGLFELDRRTGAATPWRVDPASDEVAVLALMQDRGGRLWASAGPRLFRSDGTAFTEVQFAHAGDEDPRAAISAIAEAPDGAVAALLRELEPPRTTLIRIAPGEDTAAVEHLPADWGAAGSIFIDRAGHWWLDPWHVRDGATGGSWTVLPGGAEPLVPSRMGEGPTGWLWFATDDGVYLRMKGEGRALHVLPDPTGSNWQQNLLLSCLVDRGGGVWFGSLAGLFRWLPHRKPFRHLRHERLDTTTLSGDPVSSLVEDDGGALWVGIYGAGLNHVDLASGAVRRYRKGDGGDALRDDRVWSLARAGDGGLWIGTETGLCRFDPAAETFTTVAVPGLAPAAPDARVKAIAPQHDGVLWLGTNFGLTRYDPSSGEARTFEQGPEPTGLRSRQVGDLLLEEPAALWIGSTDGDLQRLDLASGAIRHYPIHGPDGRSTTNAAVYDLERDAGGTLWIATHMGLGRLDEARGAISLALSGPPLPDAIVYSVLADGATLWLGTGRGLARVVMDSADGPAVRAFDLGAGVGNLEFNRHAALRLSDGTFAIGGMTGLTLFRPERIHDDPTPPPLALTSAEVLGASGERSLPTHGLDEVELGPRDYALILELASLAFTQPGNLRYAYRLEGFDRDFIDAGTRRYVRYTNLPPGRYTFRARGSNADGVWSRADLTLPIVVHPPFFRTWWFQGGLVTLLAAALTLGYRLRLRHLRALEQMRLRIAGDLHDELGSELSGIALVSSMLGAQHHMTDHDRARLAQVERTSLTTLQALRDIVWYINPEHDTVGSLAARMRAVADGLLGEREHEIAVEVDDRDANLPMDRRRHLLLSFKEMLHNVVRHAGDCSVRVRFAASDEGFDLEVSDDGRGFDAAQQGSGSGLASLRRRAAHLHAVLEVDSRPGGGTRIRLHGGGA